MSSPISCFGVEIFTLHQHYLWPRYPVLPFHFREWADEMASLQVQHTVGCLRFLWFVFFSSSLNVPTTNVIYFGTWNEGKSRQVICEAVTNKYLKYLTRPWLSNGFLLINLLTHFSLKICIRYFFFPTVELPENWTDTRETILEGMTFNLRHLGMTLVDQPKGEELSAAAVKRIVATVRAGVTMTMSFRMSYSQQDYCFLNYSLHLVIYLKNKL